MERRGDASDGTNWADCDDGIGGRTQSYVHAVSGGVGDADDAALLLNACSEPSDEMMPPEYVRPPCEDEQGLLSTAIPPRVVASQKEGMPTSNPYDRIGAWGATTFSYVHPLLKLCNSDTIKQQDVYGTPSRDELTNLARRVSGVWNKTYATCIEDGGDGDGNGNGIGSVNGLRKPSVWRLIRNLAGEFKLEVMVTAIYALLESAVVLAQPFFLRFLLTWLSDPTAPTARGWCFAVAIILATFFQAIVHHQLYLFTMRLGWNLRTGFTSIIHQGLLQVSATAVHKFSSAKVLNLVAIDVIRFDTFTTTIHYWWTPVLELIACATLIILEVGWLSGMSGVLVLLLSMVVMTYFGKQFAKRRKKTAHLSDLRVTTTSEVFSSMMSIKSYAWEEAFLQKIGRQRLAEAASILKAQEMKAANATINFLAPSFASLVCFIVHWAQGLPLELPVVIYVVSLFQALRLGIGKKFARFMETAPEWFIALSRIADFLSLVGNLEEFSNPYETKTTPHGSAAGSNGLSSSAGRGTASRSEDGTGTTVRVQDFVGSWPDEAMEAARATESKPSKTKENWQSSSEKGKIESGTKVAPETTCDKEPFVLKCPSFQADVSTLVAIVGRVGAGKSSLLSVLEGELTPVHGLVSIHTPMPEASGSYVNHDHASIQVFSQDTPNHTRRQRPHVAVTNQSPWIFSGTVLENILFYDAVVDETWLNAVIFACALNHDLTQLPDGLQTEIGEKGVNLSGGQKARIELARALYSGCYLQLLDDPFAAVDSTTAHHLFEFAVKPLSTGRFRIPRAALTCSTYQSPTPLDASSGINYSDPDLDFVTLTKPPRCVVYVTHHPHFAWRANALYEVENGYVHAIDVAEYRAMNEGHAHTEVALSAPHVPQDEDAALDDLVDDSEESDSVRSGDQNLEVQDKEAAQGEGVLKEKDSGDSDGSKDNTKKPSSLVVAEDRAIGVVSGKSYLAYYKAVGPILATTLIFHFFGAQALVMLADYWLQRWARKPFVEQEDKHNVHVYVAFGVSAIVIAFVGAAGFYFGTTRAGSKLHTLALSSVLNTPLNFFSANPLGRILNRFSSDLGQIDELLAPTLFEVCQMFSSSLATIVLVCIAIPWLIIPLPLFVYYLYRLRRFATVALRDLKRLEGISRSPVLAKFTSSIAGSRCVKTYHKEAEVHAQFQQSLDRMASNWFWWLIGNRWLGFRLDMSTSLVLTVTTILGVVLKTTTDPGLLGIALAYSMTLSGMFQFMVRRSALVESLMTSVERVNHYINNLPQEGATIQRLDDQAGSGDEHDSGSGPMIVVDPGKDWPRTGEITVDNLGIRYTAEGSDVLHQISFHIPAGSKVGVIGRTGSGKSSFAQALLGLLIESSGVIKIDGRPTHSLPLKTLRRSFSFIPQTPHLFQGTVGYNLDPFGEYTEDQLLDALRDVGLTAQIDDPVYENGVNFSTGERQLISLARATLRCSKLLVMDEATANVDAQSDENVQRVLKTNPAFTNCTQLVIAHRLKTVETSDYILHMHRGHAKLVPHQPTAVQA
eukprot:m.331039 g.331039  ORF g.331039 m.331039 type:complete len:1527 (+) comp16052_c2_seq5:749-5329(+)